MILNGLYMELPACGHTYGISAINNPKIYDALNSIFYSYPQCKWFRQSDSNSPFALKKDKTYLFIEFLGMKLNDATALNLCEKIAKEIGVPLDIL